MKSLKVIALTHKTTDIKNIGKLHLEDTVRDEHLNLLKKEMGLSELMYLSTCNRVEFVFTNDEELSEDFKSRFLKSFAPSLTDEDIDWINRNCISYDGEHAVRHLFHIASSLDSLVIGEREIITQVRNAYEECLSYNITGDTLRLLVRSTIESAKSVYTETNIAKNPVSIVSLAYRTLREFNLRNDARFIIIGAGETNTTMAKFLSKHGFENFVVYNRTLANGEKLGDQLSGTARPLSELKNHKGGFDVLLTCTGSQDPVITEETYSILRDGEDSKKIVIDLAIPSDVQKEVLQNNPVHYVGIEALKNKAAENLKVREKELSACNAIIDSKVEEFKEVFKERLIEKAMKDVPNKVKEINQFALDTVFAKEVGELDENTKELLNKVLSYVEKKYISVPMKMAKDIMLKKAN